MWLRHDLLFHKPGPSSLVEDEYGEYEIEAEAGEIPEDEEVEEEGWEALFLDEDEYDMESDIEMSGPVVRLVLLQLLLRFFANPVGFR